MSGSVAFGLVAFWLGFASHFSGYPIPPQAPAPQISISSHLNDKAHPCNEEWAGETMRETGAIELSSTLTGADFECTLAHELTHYLQFLNHVPLNLDPEPPAYRVTEACYGQHFHDARAAAWASSARQKHAGGKCVEH